MGVRAAVAEANKSGNHAAKMGIKHGLQTVRALQASSSVLRMPPQYTTHDVEFLLNALWTMFTGSQADRLVVAVPWDESDEPRQMVLSDFATLLESWLS